jgi:hypothetical protein
MGVQVDDLDAPPPDDDLAATGWFWRRYGFRGHFVLLLSIVNKR